MLVIFREIDTFRQNGENYVKSVRAVAAEMVLKIISSYYVERIAHLAAKNGNYSHPGSAPPDARIMYARAVVSLFFTLLGLTYILFADAKFNSLLIVVTLIGCTSWPASWLFWGEFVHHPKISYYLLP